MHVLISWDIKAEGSEWTSLNDQLKECLEGYSWIKPLSTFYIAAVEDSEDRALLRKNMIAVCKENPKKIHFIISQAMQGGSYGGWLPKTLWPKIKQLVEG